MSNHSAQRTAQATKARVKKDAGKRERILDAAVKVFAAEGFYNAKVAQIANAAGVADGTIYLYFKSKDELLISLFEDRMDRVLEALRQALTEHESAVERLKKLIELQLALVEQNPEMGEVITVELRQSAKFIREYENAKFAEFLRLIASVIADGQKSGELRDDVEPALVSRALFGALDEVALSWVVPPRRKSAGKARARGGLNEAARQLSLLFVEGLRKK